MKNMAKNHASMPAKNILDGYRVLHLLITIAKSGSADVTVLLYQNVGAVASAPQEILHTKDERSRTLPTKKLLNVSASSMPYTTIRNATTCAR